MDTTRIEPKVVRENRTARGARRTGDPAAVDARKTVIAVPDGQIAEIERTFTSRYEW